jgi:hypothetical protein
VSGKLYEFDLVIEGIKTFDDDQADALFVGGCDDGTPVSRDGVAWVHFDRTAETLETAIRSAVAQVQAAGLAVSKVVIDPADVVR